MAVQNDEEINLKTKNDESSICTTKKVDDKKIEDKIENETEEKEDDDESIKDDLEDDDKEGVSNSFNANAGKKSFLGHVCTVKTLIDDNVLIPENNALSFEFMVSLLLK